MGLNCVLSYCCDLDTYMSMINDNIVSLKSSTFLGYKVHTVLNYSNVVWLKMLWFIWNPKKQGFVYNW